MLQPQYSLERLEARIAPASLHLVNAKTATFTDVDGETSTVTFSKNLLNEGNLHQVLVTSASGAGEQLQIIDLTSLGAAAKRVDITVSSHLAESGGDGLVNVGAIRATGIDLGKVVIKGDLGTIDAGADSGSRDVALTSLNVSSLGKLGTTTGATSSSNVLKSTLLGSVGKITVAGDMDVARLALSSNADDNIPKYKLGALNVGGSITGTSTAFGGVTVEGGTLGSAHIGGSVAFSLITADAGIGTVTILGDYMGIGSEIFSFGSLGAIKIGGSVDSISEISGTRIKSIAVGGSMKNLDLYARNGDLGSISVGGTVSGSFISSGTGLLKSLVIGGDLTNSMLSTHKNMVSVKVSGDVYGSRILVGGDGAFHAPSVTLGSLLVSGDWTASSVAVGFQNKGSDDQIGGTGTATDNVNFGDSHDFSYLAPSDTAKIAKIVIQGVVSGSAPGINATDHFGFLAKQIVSITIGGSSVSLTPGPGNESHPVGNTGDVTVKEMKTGLN